MTADSKRRVVLLGYPLQHSLSPLIHNTAFEHQHLDFQYDLQPVTPGDLEAELHRLAHDGLVGANVTVPHKESVVPLLTSQSDVVKAIGATNTLSIRFAEGQLEIRGDNSDVGGFIAPIWQVLPELSGEQVLIFGSGGAARAVSYALLKYARPARIVIASRSPEKRRRLVNILLGLQLNSTIDQVDLENAGPEIRKSRLVVNTTPVGMYPNVDKSIWSDSGDFNETQIVYDLIYAPLETMLLQNARARGARVFGGLEMLISQAALSYAVWTKRKMPIDVVREKLHEHFASQQP